MNHFDSPSKYRSYVLSAKATKQTLLSNDCLMFLFFLKDLIKDALKGAEHAATETTHI